MKNTNALKWILVIGIVIVLNLFFNFAIKLVYDSPEFEDFCPQEQVTSVPTTEEACVDAGGAWTDNRGFAPKPVNGEAEGWCDAQFTCRQNYEEAREVYDRNVFVVLVVLGIASIVTGVFTAQVASVSLGLSLGGVLSFIIGSARYWSSMDDYLRVIILGLALAALIWLGIKKLRD